MEKISAGILSVSTLRFALRLKSAFNCGAVLRATFLLPLVAHLSEVELQYSPSSNKRKNISKALSVALFDYDYDQTD